MTEARSFFFHYNKPASRAAKKPKISVHHRGRCHIVDNVDCRVPVKGRHGKRQPHFVMAGRGCLIIEHRKLIDLSIFSVAIIKPKLKSWELPA